MINMIDKRSGDIIRTGQICFWLGLLIELIIVIIDKSAYINPVESQLFRLTFLLFCIKIATTRYSKKEWLCMMAVGVIAVISYLVNEKDEAVRIIAFIAACKDVPMRKILMVTLGITLLGTIVLFFLSLFGIYGTLTVTANFGRGPFPGIIETRYCFGMGHPNAFQCMLFMLSALCLYLFADSMKVYHFILLGMINYIAYVYTNSNTAYLVVLAAICGVMLLKYCSFLRNHCLAYIVGAMVVLLIVWFSVIGSHIGRETPFMYEVDQILNGRFQYAHMIESARVENWKLFGDAANQEYFDAGFIRLFYWYGIIPGAVYVAANLYLIYQSFVNKDYSMLVIVAAFTVFTIMEAHLISYYILRNYLFILLGYYWYQPFIRKNEFEGYFWQVKELLRKA